MLSWLDKIDNVFTLFSLLVFAFGLGAKMTWTVLGGRKRLHKQSEEIDALGAKIQEILNQKGVKKVTVKRRIK